MKYTYMIRSLKQITVTKVAVLLLIPELESNVCDFDAYTTIEQNVNDAVMKKVLELNIHVTLKKKILKYISLTYDQIIVWCVCHKPYLLTKGIFQWTLFSSNFYWTLDGVIDLKKTAELLVEDERLDVSGRYKLACVYCLENVIPKLWNKLPECSQKTFRDRDANKCYQWGFVAFWSHYMGGLALELNNLIENEPQCVYQSALRSAAGFGNKVAIEFFLHKLDSKVSDEFLLECMKLLTESPFRLNILSLSLSSEYFDPALCYLFLQMSESHQITALRNYGLNILKSFLHWPWLHFYIPTVECMLDFLTKEDYVCLLETIAFEATEGHRVSKYQKLFKDLWLLIPVASQLYVTHIVCSEGNMLMHLFTAEDKENIALILSNCSPNERTSVIFSSKGLHICECLIAQCDCGRNMLRFFVELCITSKDSMDQFKAKCAHLLENSRLLRDLREDDLKELRELLDDMDEELNSMQ